jgi:hypothetical protein
LYSLDVHNQLADVPVAQLRRYARRLASRAPAAGARIKEPGRTIEVACFFRYCLLATADNLILMVRRRVADLWRTARTSADRGSTSWATLPVRASLARFGSASHGDSIYEAGVQLGRLLRTVFLHRLLRQ